MTSTSAPNCENSCPIMDGGLADNTALTPVMSQSSLLPSNKPGYVSLLGGPSSTDTISYLMGVGSMKTFEMGGLNLCPFNQPGICASLTQMRKIIVANMNPETHMEYWAITNAFGSYKPEFQLLEAYCGDPLKYDEFVADCQA